MFGNGKKTNYVNTTLNSTPTTTTAATTSSNSSIDILEKLSKQIDAFELTMKKPEFEAMVSTYIELDKHIKSLPTAQRSKFSNIQPTISMCTQKNAYHTIFRPELCAAQINLLRIGLNATIQQIS